MAGPEDLKRGYKHGDYVGRSGLEQKLEQKLRGSPGFERFFVDAHGRRKSENDLGEISAARPAGRGCDRIHSRSDGGADD